MNLGLWKEMYKMSLLPVMAKSKKVLKKKKEAHNDEDISKGHKNRLKELSMAKAGTI